MGADTQTARRAIFLQEPHRLRKDPIWRVVRKEEQGGTEGGLDQGSRPPGADGRDTGVSKRFGDGRGTGLWHSLAKGPVCRRSGGTGSNGDGAPAPGSSGCCCGPRRRFLGEIPADKDCTRSWPNRVVGEDSRRDLTKPPGRRHRGDDREPRTQRRLTGLPFGASRGPGGRGCLKGMRGSGGVGGAWASFLGACRRSITNLLNMGCRPGEVWPIRTVSGPFAFFARFERFKGRIGKLARGAGAAPGRRG